MNAKNISTLKNKFASKIMINNFKNLNYFFNKNYFLNNKDQNYSLSKINEEFFKLKTKEKNQFMKDYMKRELKKYNKNKKYLNKQ